MKPLAFCAVAAAGVLAPIDAGASLYWTQGIRTTTPVSVCFVGDALTSRPARVDCFGGDVRAVIPSTSAYTVSPAVTDFLGRVHNGSAKVRVLTPAPMNGLMGSLAAITVMLTTMDEDVIFASGFE